MSMKTKHQLNMLVTASYKNELLDPKIVELIADHLNRQSLKQYIHLLKTEEKKKQIIITSPKSLTDAEKKIVTQEFPKKNIIYILDPSMLGGIRIADKESVYDMSLKQTFHDIIRHLSKYD